MRRFLTVTAIIAAALLILLLITDQGPSFRPLRHSAKQLTESEKTSECRPLRFSIGTVDPQFGITSTTLQELARSAAEEWHQATDRAWFIYDPDHPDFEINLLYDGRQADYQAMRNERDAIQAEQDRLHQLEESLRQKLDALSRLAPELRDAEAPAIEQELQQAAADWQVLQERTAAFNKQRRPYGEVFPGGQFRHAGSERSIDIFFFLDEEDLRRTLLHEFGHAMGLEHLDDPSAIMHPIKTTSRGLSEADIRAALKLAPCRQGVPRSD